MQHVTECHVEPIEGAAGSAELDEAVQHTLALAGLGCPNCVNRVRNALLETPGVLEAEIDLHRALGRVWCRAEAALTEIDLVNAVVGASRGTHHRYLAVPMRRGPARQAVDAHHSPTEGR